MRQLLIILSLLFVHLSFNTNFAANDNRPTLKADEILKTLQSKFITDEELRKLFQNMDPSDLQKTAKAIIEQSKNKFIDEFKQVSADDIKNFFIKVKNFISSKIDETKKQFILNVLKADVERYRRDEVIKRYTSRNPKDLSAKGSSFEAAFLNSRTQISSDSPDLKGRLYRVQKALGKLGLVGKLEELPRIALVFSGGGYRALTLTAGFMKAFEELGILDATLYISTLSGSTWYLGPWVFLQDPSQTPPKVVTASQYYDLILQKIGNNTFNPFSSTNVKTFSRQRFANDVVFPKMVFGQPIGVPDIFGAVLAHAWFGSVPFEEYTDRQQRMRLSNQWTKIINGQIPWPIYTSVSMHKTNGDYRYNWYEFNPEEVRNLEYGLYLPAFAFGREFEAGKPKGIEFDGKTYFAPEQSFGYLMGIFGSAYTINAIDLYRIYFLPAPSPEDVKAIQEEQAAIKQAPTLVESIESGDTKSLIAKAISAFNPVGYALAMAEVAKTLLYYAAETFIDVGKLRAAPGQILNPFYLYPDIEISSWLTNRKTITFIDAGIHYNIPLRPLFLPERKIDVIFVADASGNVTEDIESLIPIELRKAFADIERVYGIQYAPDSKISDLTMRVYRPDIAHDRAPIIVYFNFLLDPALLNSSDTAIKKIIDENNLQKFNLDKCLGEFCSTFNFAQAKDQFLQLSSLGYLNVISHKDAAHSIIQERFSKEETWFDLGTGENVEQKENVLDIIVPASEVKISPLELRIPEKDSLTNLQDQFELLEEQLNELMYQLAIIE